ncbi:MAG: cupin domain-containing protein [Bauldia sp.]|nr:cupin domain-containing protein [Bauldia sp.]
MEIKDNSRFKIRPETVPYDKTLREDRGWIKMAVRWLVTEDTAGSEMSVIGKTILAPGIGSKHDLHRHPNAEEWEYVIHGKGIKHIGDETISLETGDLSFVPRNTYHALENGSETEPLITLWGYSGAPSLEKAGYIIPEDDEKA